MLTRLCDKYGLKFVMPEMKYCMDNGAMIACAGYHMLMEGNISALDLDAKASGEFAKRKIV